MHIISTVPVVWQQQQQIGMSYGLVNALIKIMSKCWLKFIYNCQRCSHKIRPHAQFTPCRASDSINHSAGGKPPTSSTTSAVALCLCGHCIIHLWWIIIGLHTYIGPEWDRYTYKLDINHLYHSEGCYILIQGVIAYVHGYPVPWIKLNHSREVNESWSN